MKTTLDDMIKLGSGFYQKGMGKKIIKKISRQLPKNDMRYIFFYFREEICLIDNDFFNAAIISMITMVENCLRNEFYSRKINKKSKKDIEELGLGELRLEMESNLTPQTNTHLKALNKLRCLFIHKNMKVGKEFVLDNPKIITSETLLGGGSIQNRENTRVLINFYSHKYSLRVFSLSLKIIKELYPDVGKYDTEQFDEMVQKCLNPDPILYE